MLVLCVLLNTGYLLYDVVSLILLYVWFRFFVVGLGPGCMVACDLWVCRVTLLVVGGDTSSCGWCRDFGTFCFALRLLIGFRVC